MWEQRASRARREIAALAATGLGVGELHAAAIRLVDATVPTDLTCWATLDPETLAISAMVSGETRIPQEYEPRLADAEFDVREPHTFAKLARRKVRVARLSDLPAGERGRSARLNHVWRPLGLEREVRVPFLVDSACWGAAGLVRSGSDFTDRETEFLAGVAPAIAAATRLAVRTEASARRSTAPLAIVLVDADGELRALTPAAREWQERLDEIAPGRFRLVMRMLAIGSGSGGTRARVRDAYGQWAILRSSPLLGGDDDQIAVLIEPATGDQLVGLLLAAYGLTARERDVCREVLAGRSTADIAGALYISANTVQDHLKSVFAKVGIRSRRELVARLRPE
ncbi:helix-turn-helix transcriptional regulator [Flindersiella endophytica]